MGRQKEITTITEQWPGKEYVEQIRDSGGRLRYARYHPPEVSVMSRLKSVEHLPPEERKAAVLTSKPDPDIPERWEYLDKLSGDSPADNIIVERVPLALCPWIPPGEPVEPGDDLFDEVRRYVYAHVNFTDSRLYDIAAAWIMGTWLNEAWEVVPYFFFLGPVSSGKTRALEVLYALSYRGVLGSTISEAALYQCVEFWSATLLLDEVERYNREKWATVQNILNSGYRQGQPAIRARIAENGVRFIDLFNVFGFKAMAGTEGLLRTLESRSLIVYMAKSRRKVRFLIDKAWATQIKSRLLLWRWRQLGLVQEISRAVIEETIKDLDFADGRNLELFATIYTVAPQARPSIITYAYDLIEDTQSEDETSIEAEVTMTLFRVSGRVSRGRVALKDICEVFNEDKDPSFTMGAKALSQIVKRLGFKRRRTTDSQAGFEYDAERLKNLAVRYAIPEEISGIKETIRPLDGYIPTPLSESTAEGPPEANEGLPGSSTRPPQSPGVGEPPIASAALSAAERYEAPPNNDTPKTETPDDGGDEPPEGNLPESQIRDAIKEKLNKARFQGFRDYTVYRDVATRLNVTVVEVGRTVKKMIEEGVVAHDGVYLILTEFRSQKGVDKNVKVKELGTPQGPTRQDEPEEVPRL